MPADQYQVAWERFGVSRIRFARTTARLWPWANRIRANECSCKPDRIARSGKPFTLRPTPPVCPVSQYLADVLAEHVGRPDLVRELGRNEEVLPLAM